jgi:hypothetical protein
VFYGGDTVVASSLSAAITQADTDLQTHAAKYIAIQVGSDVVVFANTDGTAGHISATDDAIILSGRALTDISGTNFI